MIYIAASSMQEAQEKATLRGYSEGEWQWAELASRVIPEMIHDELHTEDNTPSSMVALMMALRTSER